jgi:3-hydroxybutyrate dehydrogenase
MTKLTGRPRWSPGRCRGSAWRSPRGLAGAGARIAVHGLASAAEAEAATAALQEAGAPEARFFDADMRDTAAIETMMADLADWGGADILVNNAGIQKTVSLADADAATWDAILAVNLSGAFHTMRLAMPAMAERGYGRVINIASVHGLVASVNKAPYVASKFGLVGMSKVAALEYADGRKQGRRRRDGELHRSGWTETAIIEPQVQARAAQFGGDRDKGIADLLAEKQPSRRTSDPSEIASLALWLCDPVAHNVTGTTIPVDGGWTAQ